MAGGIRIAISGASGLVGSSLRQTLERAEAGFEVRPIVRRACVPDGITWSPTTGEVDVAALEGVDAVVHLAGEPIGPARWSQERKQGIRGSRVDGTRALAQALASLRSPPKVMVQASAVGFYGNTGDQWAHEGSPCGEGFLAGVCRDWEVASAPAEEAGIRVARLRFGHVLGHGGLLHALRRPTKLGLGGRLGSGRQFWSWIGIADLVSVILAVLGDATLPSVVNAVSPGPARNAEFAERFAALLHRPAWLPAPELALKLAFGAEQAREMLLWGQRVRPAVLQDRGFEWSCEQLDAALRAVVDDTIELPVERARALAASLRG
ncbi:MAG: TIGR01777 family oxidoreductase [Myxococcales bacterium]|nr:TIGR01777 family oxidoreductase [Myxococcales bacterium]